MHKMSKRWVWQASGTAFLHGLGAARGSEAAHHRNGFGGSYVARNGLEGFEMTRNGLGGSEITRNRLGL